MKTLIFSVTLYLFGTAGASGFCGFFVAKADSKLFNKSSSVIMVRNENQTTITMAQDYQGAAKDFAMVIPVPVVLEREQINTIESGIFTKLDQYSAPRLAQYYDNCPCYDKRYRYKKGMMLRSSSMTRAPRYKMEEETKEKSLGIEIKARYSVGEYDIVILSAKHSNGLEIYLNDKGYKIPTGAKEVLEPYVKSNMKFFLVKVNLEKAAEGTSTNLKPIQITFESPKFMLPIRLGMANANGTQDMVVYAFSKKGRIETTNYKTVKIPTNTEIPLPVNKKFGNFYKAVFEKTFKKSDKKSVFLEYAWDVSQRAPVKCDPCVGPPPLLADLTKVGVDWLDIQGWGKVYISRLHVRYDRKNFPQDLVFQETSNTSTFQGRYVIHQPSTCNLDCAAGQRYIQTLQNRRRAEVNNLVALTGWDASKYNGYVNEFKAKPIPKRTVRKNNFMGLYIPSNGGDNNFSSLNPYSSMQGNKLLLYFLIFIVIFSTSLHDYRRRRFTQAKSIT